MSAGSRARQRAGLPGRVLAVALVVLTYQSPAATVVAQDAPLCTDVVASGSFSFADRALAVSSSGDLYTTSGITVTGRDPVGATVVFAATAPPDFVQLIDLALTAGSEVVALDASGKIARFAPDGTLIGTIDIGDINVIESSIAAHPDGRIWVADPFTNTLRAFTVDGSLSVEVDSSERPGDIEVTPSGDLVVVDGFERNIRWYSSDGEPLRTVTIGHVNAAEVELAVDSAGRIHVSDPFTDAVQVFAPDGAHLVTVAGSRFTPPLDRPVAIEPLPGGGVLVGDSFTGTSYTVSIVEEPDPVLVTLEASASPDDIDVGQPAQLTVRVAVTAVCPAGPFEVAFVVPDGLTATGGTPSNGSYWLIDPVDSVDPTFEFLLDVVGTAAGTHVTTFALSGPGVATDVTATIVVRESTTSTSTPPTSTAPTPTTSTTSTTEPVTPPASGPVDDASGGLPATGRSSPTIAVIALVTVVVGAFLVRRSLPRYER